MLSVSQEFNDAADSVERSVKAAVIMHFLGKQALPFATAIASSQYDASTPPSQACSGRIRMIDYTSSGYMPEHLSLPHNGWRGTSLASADGTLSATEVLTVTYNVPITGKNLWIVGIRGYYPVNFTVERRIAGVWTTVVNVVGNTDYVWTHVADTAELTEAVRLTITKIAPALGSCRIMQFGLVSTVVFEGFDLIDLELSCEAKSDANNPLGTVSSNECSASLSNSDKWFSPRNTASPFYSLLEDKITMQSFVGLGVGNNTFEFVPLGTYTTGDWDVPSTSTEASVTSYDSLYSMLSKPVPEVKLLVDTTVGKLFEALFIALGITDYDIDTTLIQEIKYGWIPTGTIGETLTELSIAGSCYVFVSRMDKLVVKSCFQTSTHVATLTDTSQIIDINNPQRNRNKYTSVVVNCAVPKIQNPELVAELSNVLIPTGVTTFSAVKFSSGPVASVSHVMVAESLNVIVTDFTWGPWTTSITVNNTGSEETISLEVYGYCITNTSTALNEDNSNNEGRTLVVDSLLIQTPAIATQYATDMLAYASNPLASIPITVRGNPALELIDTVLIQDSTNLLTNVSGLIMACRLTYDGGLSMDISTMVKS